MWGSIKVGFNMCRGRKLQWPSTISLYMPEFPLTSQTPDPCQASSYFNSCPFLFLPPLPPPTSHPHPQGLLAPIVLSISLFGLYLILKYTDLDLQTFMNAYFWLLASVALTSAAAPLLRRAGDALGQPDFDFSVPEGLLLDERGEGVTRVTLVPSSVIAALGAVGLTTWDAMHHSSFTLNNMVGGGREGE